MTDEQLEYPFELIRGCYLTQHEPAEWDKLLRFLKIKKDSSCKVYIPVTADSFDDLGKYNKEICKLVREGYVYGYAKLVGDTVEAKYCIEDRGVGDEDGYGVEPDEWLIAKLDLNGNYIERFHLID